MAIRFGAPLTVALLASIGCHRTQASTTPGMCDDGDCMSALDDCELGSCAMPQVALTRRSHSPQAGTFVEGGTQCPFVEGELPPRASVLNVAHIPEFRRARDRKTNMDAGDARPQDIDLHEQLMGMQGRIFACIDLAACYDQVDPYVAGALDFEFELEPTGQVSAVSVAPSPSLSDAVIQACARRSLYEFRFPSWNGGRMIVSYRVEVGESA